MPVATFVQPNRATQNGTQYTANIDQAIASLGQTGNQFAPHEAATPNMTVVVEGGQNQSGTLLIVKGQQTTGTITAPTTNPRIDRVVIDQKTGDIEVVTGAEAASPVAPDIPQGKIACCQFTLQTSTMAITNLLIVDERALFPLVGNSFRGALVRKAIDQSINDSTTTNITFDTEEIDTDGFHDNAVNNHLFTIPTGIAIVRLFAQIVFDANATGFRRCLILGPSSKYNISNQNNLGAIENVAINFMSKPFLVSSGNTFLCSGYQNSGGALNVVGAANGSMFGIEVLE